VPVDEPVQRNAYRYGGDGGGPFACFPDRVPVGWKERRILERQEE
jgi:hypothetical protein